MSLQNITLPQYTGRLEELTPAQVVQEGLSFPIDPIIKLGTMQPIQQMTERTPGPLAAMTESSLPPSSADLPIRGADYDDLLEQLISHGYLVQYRLYEGSDLSYLMTRSRAGDVFLIQLEQPRASLSRLPEIRMQRRRDLTVVPQEIKVGALQCLNYDICGAAFVCDGNLCLAERPPQDPTGLVETDFALESPLEGIRLGRSVVAYPVVQLSDLLAQPQEYEGRLAQAADAMANLGMEVLNQDTRSFLQALDEVRAQVIEMATTAQDLQSQLDREIDRLTQFYLEIRHLHPGDLPDDEQARYYLLLKSLADRKARRRQLIDAMANAQLAADLVRAVPKEIQSQLEPVLAPFQV